MKSINKDNVLLSLGVIFSMGLLSWLGSKLLTVEERWIFIGALTVYVCFGLWVGSKIYKMETAPNSADYNTFPKYENPPPQLKKENVDYINETFELRGVIVGMSNDPTFVFKGEGADDYVVCWAKINGKYVECIVSAENSMKPEYRPRILQELLSRAGVDTYQL